MWESTSLPNIFTSFNMFQHLIARRATFAAYLSEIIQLPSQNSYLFIVCLNKVVQNKLLYHSPHQIAERSHLVCLRLSSSQRGPPPSGWGSALAPKRPGLDSDPELSPEPGTELDMTPLTPGTGQRGNVRIELHVLQGFSSCVFRDKTKLNLHCVPCGLLSPNSVFRYQLCTHTKPQKAIHQHFTWECSEPRNTLLWCYLNANQCKTAGLFPH